MKEWEFEPEQTPTHASGHCAKGKRIDGNRIARFE
jgi:hypothetical protein